MPLAANWAKYRKGLPFGNRECRAFNFILFPKILCGVKLLTVFALTVPNENDVFSAQLKPPALAPRIIRP
jgi:hypothetical protein